MWYCKSCISRKENETEPKGVTFFLRYMDNIVRTVKKAPQKVLQATNGARPQLQLTIETPKASECLSFLDLETNIDNDNVSCGWCQKPTDTGTILNIRSSATLQYKKDVSEGTDHRVFRSTSTWEGFDKAMKINRKQWSDNQYPDHWSSWVASRALKMIIGENNEIR